MQERYKRNIMLESVGEQGQKILSESKVLVVGAGGLGSCAIQNLAALGVGEIGIVDFDVVEESNFNRQLLHKPSCVGLSKVESARNWVNEFNPGVRVHLYDFKLDEANVAGVVADFDVVVDCVDNFDAKFLLNKTCVELRKKFVHGGVEEMSGQVMCVGAGSACLGCLFEDFESNQPKGIISPVVNIVGSLQSAEVVKLLLGVGEPLFNCVLSYDCLNSRFAKISVAKNPSCAVCSL